MALVLDGTNGVSGVDGTASNPSLEGTDSNTGVFFPAADTVAIGTGGTEALRVDSARNMGLGVTPSAWSLITANQIKNASFAGYLNRAYVFANSYFDGSSNRYIASDFATYYSQQSGQHQWYNAASGTAGNAISFTQAMTLDASGNLQIGTTTSSGANITVYGSSEARTIYQNSTSGTGAGNGFYVGTSGADALVYHYENGPLLFATNGTERARITSGGFFKSSNTGTYIGSTGAYHELISDSTNSVAYIRNTNASPTGLDLSYSAASPNGTGNPFLYCQDSTALRASIRSNGGLANYSANNVNLSDRREKTNFAPAKNYLDVICAIPVQTFNYLDQNVEDDPGLTLGVVAQDVQEVAPELVMESNWGTEEEPKMRLSIYQTDLQYALMKSIQELKAIVDAQAAEIAALKGNA